MAVDRFIEAGGEMIDAAAIYEAYRVLKCMRGIHGPANRIIQRHDILPSSCIRLTFRILDPTICHNAGPILKTHQHLRQAVLRKAVNISSTKTFPLYPLSSRHSISHLRTRRIINHRIRIRHVSRGVYNQTIGGKITTYQSAA